MHPCIQEQVDAILQNDNYQSLYISFRQLASVNRKTLLKVFKEDIERDHVRDMEPEKLGKIICSLDAGGVSTDRDELIRIVDSAYDHEDMLRKIVTSSLANIIWEKFEPEERRPRGMLAQLFARI